MTTQGVVFLLQQGGWTLRDFYVRPPELKHQATQRTELMTRPTLRALIRHGWVVRGERTATYQAYVLSESAPINPHDWQVTPDGAQVVLGGCVLKVLAQPDGQWSFVLQGVKASALYPSADAAKEAALRTVETVLEDALTAIRAMRHFVTSSDT